MSLRRTVMVCLLSMVAAAARCPAATVKAKPRSTDHAALKRPAGSKARAGTAKSKSHAPVKGTGTKKVGGAKGHGLRTAPASPGVREGAVARIERTLARTGTAPFLYPDAMKPLFAALTAEQADHTGAPGTASLTVRMLQYGDSHTAADIFTGELRARLQANFGDGGLGFQFPGHPFAGYHLAGSTRTQTPGWLTEGNHFTALGDGDLGLGGIGIETSQPGQTVTDETSCETLQLQFLRQVGGGRLQFSDNGTPVSPIETALAPEGSGLPTTPAATFTYACTAGPHEFRWTTLDAAPVKLLGIVTEQPGVTYECLGINGAEARLMLRWNPALFAEYLRQRAPNLIVLAYGTNEAGSSTELADYPAVFAQLLDTLHRVAPDAAVLVLGPYERDVAAGRGRRRTWHVLGGVDRIVAVQKEACRTHGCAFWDARQRMGGPGSMPQWVAAGLAQPDRTHLTGTGYRDLADALYTDLMGAYNGYQRRSGEQGVVSHGVEINVHGDASGVQRR